MNPGNPIEEALLLRAADWLARRDAGFTPDDAAAFAAWLERDPRHAHAVAELESAWATLHRPRETGHADRVIADLEARVRLRRSRRTKRITWIGTSLAAAAAIALAVWLPSRPTAAPARVPFATVPLRPERQTLTDGSVVELNAGAVISVAFSPTRRDVKLLRGEAHFAVTKDAARPFVVSAGGVEAQAVGTEFVVTFAPKNVQVLVTEGRVAVASRAVVRDTARTPVFVDAGARVTIPLAASSAAAEPRLDAMAPDEIARALAWRGKRVEFSGTPLAEAVALFNRQNRVQLTLADESLGELRVSGIFWADDPSGFARLLEPSFSLHTRRVTSDRIEIGR